MLATDGTIRMFWQCLPHDFFFANLSAWQDSTLAKDYQDKVIHLCINDWQKDIYLQVGAQQLHRIEPPQEAAYLSISGDLKAFLRFLHQENSDITLSGHLGMAKALQTYLQKAEWDSHQAYGHWLGPYLGGYVADGWQSCQQGFAQLLGFICESERDHPSVGVHQSEKKQLEEKIKALSARLDTLERRQS